MSELTDCKQSADSASRKRPSPDQDEDSAIPCKSSKVSEASEEPGVTSESCTNSEAESKKALAGNQKITRGKTSCRPTQKSSERIGVPPLLGQVRLCSHSTAEALASLTGGDGEDSEETPCSSEKAKQVKHGNKFKTTWRPSVLKNRFETQAAAADSSTSVHSTDKEDAVDMPECAIVSVKMAPEMRQSVALLAQVQMRLEALEKKSARLHQRLDSITKTIPGFWVTALLNHPHLSAHIDETDEDALSYMTDLEIESFKNNKLGYRIRFHFRRNPYFQNNIIMKELHLGMGGSPMSFSNPILWHRGHNLTPTVNPGRRHVGSTDLFQLVSDHSNPGQDECSTGILKDDLFRDPLRYYLTPLWEPRENGSGARAADNGNGDDCVVISDSDDEPGEEASEEATEPQQGRIREEEEEEEEGEEEEEEEDEEEKEEDGEEDKEEEVEEEDRGPGAG
uniref:Testis specific protein Y-linked n=1 Tax=Sphaeramia orbicularis TaxID=375764 RepID=A0A673BPE4_9TELE